jgi:hypothetical protein
VLSPAKPIPHRAAGGLISGLGGGTKSPFQGGGLVGAGSLFNGPFFKGPFLGR